MRGNSLRVSRPLNTPHAHASHPRTRTRTRSRSREPSGSAGPRPEARSPRPFLQRLPAVFGQGLVPQVCPRGGGLPLGAGKVEVVAEDSAGSARSASSAAARSPAFCRALRRAIRPDRRSGASPTRSPSGAAWRRDRGHELHQLRLSGAAVGAVAETGRSRRGMPHRARAAATRPQRPRPQLARRTGAVGAATASNGACTSDAAAAGAGCSGFRR